MELHELEDFEDVLEFEDPLLRLESEENFDPIARNAVCSFVNSCMNDLEYFRITIDSHFRNKALIVLEYLDSKLLRFSATLSLNFANSELHASKPIRGDRMLHL